MSLFKLQSPYKPTGDQPKAIKKLVLGINDQLPSQVLLGVTGSGKTFSLANVIAQTNLPTLVVSHNKTLAAQLYQELRDFFPDNAVSYFVSYYDYYQPEAYIPSTDTYIEKETEINDEIDKLRLSSTTNLLTRPDVIVVASVSCIYNLGSPIEYGKYILEIMSGQVVARQDIFSRLIDLQYERSDSDLHRGSFRVRGDNLQLWPAYSDYALRILLLENQIESITPVDPVSAKPFKRNELKNFNLYPDQKKFIIYPAKHHITNPKAQTDSFKQIATDLKAQLDHFNQNNQPLKAHRLKQKVSYDLESIQEFGFVSGIENYSRYFDGRNPGEAPYTLLDYFQHNAQTFDKPNFLTVIDESHITLPQVRGMYRGDQSRKQTLIDYGFRLPSALDNRPLKFEEFLRRTPNMLFVSATPNEWEISYSQNQVVEQLIRPTGLLDPQIDIRPSQGQIPDLVKEILKRIKKGQRILVTTLTKRMAEDLTEFLNDEKKLTNLFDDTVSISPLPKVAYLHSEVHTLDRSDILDSLRAGEYDVLVGINLLREGLDLPEVSLVAIIDADKEGFLRSTQSLIQVMGRAARHQDGQVVMYADKITKSMQAAIDETSRRRQIQEAYNQKHGITPTSIQKPIREVLIKREQQPDTTSSTVHLSKKESIELDDLSPGNLTPNDRKKMIKKLNRRMKQAARELDFELAAALRDKITELESA